MSLPLHDLRVTILGSGRVGTSLGASLRAAGATVVVTSSRGALHTDDAELVLIAVSDAALAEVVSALEPKPGQVIAHTSGRHGLDVLAGVRDSGAFALAFHLAMPFGGEQVELAGAAIGLTADAEALPLAERLCKALGAQPVWIAEDDRDLYHAALCHSANHLVTLVAEAAELLRATGVGDPSAVLGALTRAALEGALERGDAATTGPVVRGDTATVSAHVAAIHRSRPEIDASYRALAEQTTVLAQRRGTITHATAEVITHALQGARV